MNTLFILLFFASIIALVVGLVRPKTFSRFVKGELTRKKVGLTLGIATLILFSLAVATTEPTTNVASTKQTAVPTATVTPNQPTKQAEPTKKPITYEVVKRWSIPNGGEGKVVLIPPDYLNEIDMTALGEKLKNDTKNDRNAFIFVFTDKKAADMRDKVLSDELSDTDRDFYDKHYVGQYNKNANSGFHEFAIYFDGVMGTNHKTIKY